MPNPLMLSGKKTYLVALFVVFVGVVEGLFGIDLPGIEVGPDWLQYILAGAGLGSLRAAVAKLYDMLVKKNP